MNMSPLDNGNLNKPSIVCRNANGAEYCANYKIVSDCGEQEFSLAGCIQAIHCTRIEMERAFGGTVIN